MSTAKVPQPIIRQVTPKTGVAGSWLPGLILQEPRTARLGVGQGLSFTAAL